VNSEKHGH